MIIRAVGITQFGGPDVLTVVSRPMPVPQSGEVRIRVAAASVNPTDVWMRAGRSAKALRDIPPPWTPGMDLAGTIDLVGPDVEFTVGDTVIAIVVPLRPLGGAQAEFVIVPACSVARVPPGLSLTDAATIPLNALTARLALDRLDLRPGASLAITGAAGALGGYAIQLAKMDGLTVVAAGSADDAQLLTDLGADVVVERGREVSMTRDAIPGGVDAAIDSAVVGKEILSAIRDEGQLASVRAWRDPSDRGIVIRPIWITDYITNGPALRQLAGLAGEGRLTLRVAREFPPERVAVAHRLLEAGGLRGRCVISFE